MIQTIKDRQKENSRENVHITVKHALFENVLVHRIGD